MPADDDAQVASDRDGAEVTSDRDGAQVVSALAEHLGAVTFAELGADAVTALLIDQVAGWAEERGWRVYRRAASVLRLPPPMQNQHSVLDVAIARPGGLPPLAVEVDHGHRKRTLEKLAAEGAAGRIPILVRWGGRKATEATPPTHVIVIDVDQHPGARFTRGRLRPPPPHSSAATGDEVALPLDY